MKHLTVDEIIDFVSFDKIDDKTLELSDRVNGHIRNCDECLGKVRAFQMLYDEFVRIKGAGDFRRFVYNVLSADAAKKTGDETVHRYNKQQKSF